MFDEADLTRYEGTASQGVTYYSRSNWVGTVTGTVKLMMNDKIIADVVLTDEDLPSAAGYTMPTMGKDAGLHGTGLNIHRSPYAGRVFEYYSEDGILTGLIDTVETVGIQSKGMYVYNKHFVLNDQEDNRAGIGT